MKNIIIITGGAGFVGSNLIVFLLKKTKFKIISIDNYSSDYKIILRINVLNISKDIQNISILLDKYKNKIRTVFHFGEFSRIYQSFKYMNDCIQSNTIGSNAVFDFCLKIKLN